MRASIRYVKHIKYVYLFKMAQKDVEKEEVALLDDRHELKLDLRSDEKTAAPKLPTLDQVIYSRFQGPAGCGLSLVLAVLVLAPMLPLRHTNPARTRHSPYTRFSCGEPSCELLRSS